DAPHRIEHPLRGGCIGEADARFGEARLFPQLWFRNGTAGARRLFGAR
ncbi:MAG: hypothetical protein ACI80K_003103, partial [Paracoccaceae bacterium]